MRLGRSLPESSEGARLSVPRRMFIDFGRNRSGNLRQVLLRATAAAGELVIEQSPRLMSGGIVLKLKLCAPDPGASHARADPYRS